MATKLKPPPSGRIWRPSRLNIPQVSFDSPLTPQKSSFDQAPFGLPITLPSKFKASRIVEIPQYRRVLAALSANDSFEVWIAYLGLREYLKSAKEPVLDRTLFTKVLLSLRIFNMVAVTAKGVKWARKRSSFEKFGGIDPVKGHSSVVESLAELPLEVRSSIKALPAEQMWFTRSHELAAQFPVEGDPFLSLWRRISLVEQDIKLLFGDLTQLEYMHLLICATKSKIRGQKMWTTLQERRVRTPEGDVRISPSVRMWNVYIMTMCDTRTSALKRVRGVGSVFRTPSDPLNSLKGLDYKRWILDYIEEDYSEFATVDSSSSPRPTAKSRTPARVSQEATAAEPKEKLIGHEPKEKLIGHGLHLLQSSADALIYMENMVAAGTLPNHVTYSALVLALSKSGMLASIQAVIEIVWHVRPGKIIEEAVPLGSRLYPDMYTLGAIFNAFASNSRRDLGSEYVHAMVKKYRVTLNGFIKSVMEENFVVPESEINLTMDMDDRAVLQWYGSAR